jgi:hypothetical protein
MVADKATEMSLSIDPLTFVLHPIAAFGMVIIDGSFITFLFVHLSVFASGLTFDS